MQFNSYNGYYVIHKSLFVHHGFQEGVWEVFAEEGEMKMYKREEEVDGMVVDPLKAIHQVSGVTARELCHYFFSPGTLFYLFIY